MAAHLPGVAAVSNLILAAMDYRSTFHTPVLVEAVLKLLCPVDGGLYLDGTVGGGGHCLALLEASAPGGRVYALDRDAEAVLEARRRLAAHSERLHIEQANYFQAPEVFPGIQFNGVLLDLGVSSHQFDFASRGFSCDREGPLDMRMDPNSGIDPASELILRAGEAELSRIFRDWGETPFHRRIARGIVRARVGAPLENTGNLAAIVRSCVPVTAERKSLVQVFQALRIAVNDELGALERGLSRLFDCLVPGGRFAVIAYHSLEDRLVKHFFRAEANPCICPPGLPICGCGRLPRARILTAKPLRPSEHEVETNPRSRSAHLRAAERLAA